MITTARVGRNLHITVEGVDDPYVIHPLPGHAGMQISDTFLGSAGGLGTAEELAEALMMAVDGAVQDEETGRWTPLPEDQRINYNRLGRELRQSEAESVLMPAYFWQSILGDEGVRLYVEGGEGLSGTLKATGAMAGRLRLLQQRTSPNGVLGILTQTGLTPTDTHTRPAGKKPASGKRKKRKPAPRR